MPKEPGYILLIPLLFLLCTLGGCSSAASGNAAGQEKVEPEACLPPVERVIPDDPYMFLPLEYVRFQLKFKQEVNPDVLAEAIFFEPELAFDLQVSADSLEVYLEPQERLTPDTLYALKIKNIKDAATGKTLVPEYKYRTEFQGDREIINPRWSHDGEELVYLQKNRSSDTAELWKVNIKSLDKKLLASGLGWPGMASWSPDDSSLLYTKMVQKSEYLSVPEICTIDREGKKERVIVRAEDLEKVAEMSPCNAYAWWSPTGSKIVLQLDIGGVDAHSDLLRAMAVADSDGSGLLPIDGQIFAGWQGDDLLVLKTHENYNHSHAYRYDMFVVGTDGQVPGKLLVGEGQIKNFGQASQSKDFSILVIGRWESLNAGSSFKREGTSLLYCDLSQNLLFPIAFAGYQKHPAVSPEGKRIVFACNAEGNWDLHLWENGTSKPLTREPGHEVYPVWSPAGDALAFVSGEEGRETIKLIEPSSGKVIKLTE